MNTEKERNQHDPWRSQPLIATDYHTHSTFSPDAVDSISAMSAMAYHRGLQQIAITDHAEWHPKWFTQPNWDNYFQAVERTRVEYAESPLDILTGVELGNPHHYLDAVYNFQERYQFDITILSIHWLYDENIHDAACFAGRDATQVYRDYFEEMGRMVEAVPGTFVAHFDRIFWRGVRMGARFDERALRGIIEDTLGAIIERGLGLELNTKYLASTPDWHETLIMLLEWYQDLGGQRLVVNSDAHATHQLLQNQELALNLMSTAGIERPWSIQPASLSATAVRVR